MSQLSSNLNASAQEFFPATSRRLSASVSEFIPSPRYTYVSTSGFDPPFGGLSASAFVPFTRELSISTLDFIPSRNLNPSIGYVAIYQEIIGTSRSISEEEERVRRTIFVTEINTHITEMELAHEFAQFGLVIDCRICGDTWKGLRFGFVEFENEYCAVEALWLDGEIIHTNTVPIRVKPSHSSLVQVNPFFLPQTEEEEDLVLRTVYCRNIDRALSEEKVRDFFDESVGEVSRIRLFGNPSDKTLNAFIEFVNEYHARTALGLSGTKLGNLTVRVTCSKTPIKPPRFRNRS